MELKSFLGRGRKGQVYSLMVILLSIPIIIFIFLYMSSSQTIKFGSIDTVVADQQYMLSKNIVDDYERAIGISGKRALLAVSNYVMLNGKPITDSHEDMKELLSNGTLYGDPSSLMNENTFMDWKEKINTIRAGFNQSVDYDGIVIENYDGESIMIRSNVSINISDYANVSSIRKVIEKDVIMSIEGFDDPIFVLNTEGQVKRTIEMYPYTYYTKKLFSGSIRAGNCTGTVTFDPLDTGMDKILVTDDASNISGPFLGIVGQDSEGIPEYIDCYVVGDADSISTINSTIQQEGYDKIYLDEETGVWSMPMADNLQYYFKFNFSTGPDFLMRLENDLSQADFSFETFVVEEEGIPLKYSQTRQAHKYFLNQTLNGKWIRGFPSWFRLDDEGIAKYGFDQLETTMI